MCMFCSWGELYPEEEPETPESLDRKRASQESWAKLMDEIARADSAAEAARAQPPQKGASAD